MKLTRRLVRVGASSMGIVIPLEFVRALGLELHDPIEVEIADRN
jgi:antitoxin component of MazEF toxin-antitoxin module